MLKHKYTYENYGFFKARTRLESAFFQLPENKTLINFIRRIRELYTCQILRTLRTVNFVKYCEIPKGLYNYHKLSKIRTL